MRCPYPVCDHLSLFGVIEVKFLLSGTQGDQFLEATVLTRKFKKKISLIGSRWSKISEKVISGNTNFVGHSQLTALVLWKFVLIASLICGLKTFQCKELFSSFLIYCKLSLTRKKSNTAASCSLREKFERKNYNESPILDTQSHRSFKY